MPSTRVLSQRAYRMKLLGNRQIRTTKPLSEIFCQAYFFAGALRIFHPRFVI